MVEPVHTTAKAPAANSGKSRSQTTNSSSQPLLSIVVVVFRDRDELLALLDNLIPFRSGEVELIVVDGASDDGSELLLAQRSDRIDFWLSEPDTGVYDAMNKGIAAARGKYILHINAGDRLCELPLAELAAMADRNVDVVCCRVLEDGHHLYTSRNDWLMRIDNTWHHQGTFYLRSAHLGYDTRYRVFADFDHNQRLRRKRPSVEMLDLVIATHLTNGLSGTDQNRNEIFRIVRSNYGVLYSFVSRLRSQALALRRWMRRKLASL